MTANGIRLIPKHFAEAGHDDTFSTEPCLTILEQPTAFYRFRYESEITEGRVGGLLLGRSSTGSSKSFIKLRISGINPLLHKHLQLTVCTVSPDKAHHPYYLHGDECHSGFFKLEKEIDETSPSYMDVTFDRLAVICIAKTASAIQEGMRKRMESVSPVFACLPGPSRSYDGRNLSRIRLAFALAYQDHSDQWGVTFGFSDEISDKKENKALDLEELNPPEAPLKGGAEIAIYTKTATNGITKSEAKVSFLLEGGFRELIFPVNDIRKHLITVTAPDVRSYAGNERVKATVTIQVGSAVSSELAIVFVNRLSAVSVVSVETTRKRGH